MKPPCPPIVTYHSTNAPLDRAWIARYTRMTKPNAEGEIFERALPMLFSGGTEIAVIARAQEWWETETEKQERMRLPPKQRRKVQP